MKIVNGNRVAENADEAMKMFRKALAKRKLDKYRDDDGSTVFDKEEREDYSSFKNNKKYYDYGLE